MYTTSDRMIIEPLLQKANYFALPLIGVNATFNPDWLVDDLEEPKGMLYSPHYFSFVYSEEESYLKTLCNEQFTDGFYGFSGTHPKIFEYMKQHQLIDWLTISSQYHYVGTNEAFDGYYTIETVDKRWASEIDDLYEYKSDNTILEITRAIEERPSACICIEGVLASWVLLHDDYSIGFMYTKPEYRKLGLGKLVSQAIISICVDKGITPFLQIVHGNHKSEGLAQKSGFIKHADVYWFGIVVPGTSSVKNIREDYLAHFLPMQPIQYISSYGLTTLREMDSRYTLAMEVSDILVYQNEVLQGKITLVNDRDTFYLFNEVDYLDWIEVLKVFHTIESNPYVSVLFSSTQTLEGVQSIVVEGEKWALNL